MCVCVCVCMCVCVCVCVSQSIDPYDLCLFACGCDFKSE